MEISFLVFVSPFNGDFEVRCNLHPYSWYFSKQLSANVVTLYEDAAKLRGFIGDNGRDLTHVVVLNSEGMAVWFNQNGYSEEAGSQLLRTLRHLAQKS